MSTPIENLRDKGWGPAKLSIALSAANPAAAITPQAISQWRKIPAERVIEIASVTGIPAADLRPDLAAVFAPTALQPEAAAS